MKEEVEAEGKAEKSCRNGCAATPNIFASETAGLSKLKSEG